MEGRVSSTSIIRTGEHDTAAGMTATRREELKRDEQGECMVTTVASVIMSSCYDTGRSVQTHTWASSLHSLRVNITLHICFRGGKSPSQLTFIAVIESVKLSAK